MEKLVSGMDYASWVGRVVNLDVTTRSGKYTVTGELLSVLDQFQQGDVSKTILTIGGERLVLDWHDSNTEASIETRMRG